ncbi:MAG: hypothetical protein AAB522_00035 [Patescibacteria group bacterium]
MRNDFSRIVIESPRRGSWMPNRKTRLRITENNYNPEVHDLLPTRESMCRINRITGWFYKEFTDVIGPINRFLKSRLGQMWDDVFSEIAKAIPANSPQPIWHVRKDHIMEYVERHCFVGPDGKIWSKHWFVRPEQPVDGFYVHPETGRLEYQENRPIRRKTLLIGNNLKILMSDPETGKEAKLVVKVDDTTRAEKHNGIWFLFFYRRLAESERKTKDIFGRVFIHPPLKLLYKKQASKKELRALGLSNDRPR